MASTLENLKASPTSNLHCEILCNHAVPGSQVPVDKLIGIQVGHAVCNFSGHLDHLFKRWQDLAVGVLWHSKEKGNDKVL